MRRLPYHCAALAVGVIALMAAQGWLAASGAPAAATTPNATCSDTNGIVACTLVTSNDADSIDLSAIVSGLSADGVTSTTPMWIQAWGGSGGHGGGYNIQASGGLGGYSQTVTTLDDLQSSYGTSTLYYYVGDDGLGHGSSTDDTEGGDGAASTVVSTADLTSVTPTVDVDSPPSGNVLLLAGGGGGGAGESPNINSVGDGGGGGGIAVASTTASMTTAGLSAEDKGGSVNGEAGKGGQCPDGGAKGTSSKADGADGGSGVGGEGGGGGEEDSGHFGSTGWVNTSSVTLSDAGSGGHGGAGTYNLVGYAGAGGGGGGGYGGGGGGASAYTGDPGGGGGGCSFAAKSLKSDVLAPTGYQSNPVSGSGAVQVTFDTVNSTATFEIPPPASPGDSGTFTASYKVATSSGTKKFYAAGGTLSGAWDGSTDTLSSASGDVNLESNSGAALSQAVSIDQGASITPVSGSADCPSGESEYALSGGVAVTDVPVFGQVTGSADLTGCGSITGTVTYSGTLSDLSPSDITAASVADLELQMTASHTSVPSALAFTSVAQQVTTSTSAAIAMTVQLQDSTGAATTADAATTVDLATSSPTGYFSSWEDGSPTTSVTIPAGSSSVTFYYGDDTDGGSPVITASSGALTSATQTEYVAGAPKTVVFTTSPVSGPASSSTNLGPISAEYKDSKGFVTIDDTAFDFSTTASSVYFSKTLGGTKNLGYIALSSSTTTATTSTFTPGPYTAYIGSTNAGTIVVKAEGVVTSQFNPDATQTETVTAAGSTEVAVSSPAETEPSVLVATTGRVSLFTLRLQDRFGNAAPRNVPTQVELRTSSARGHFSRSANMENLVRSVILAPHQASAAVYYRDGQTGEHTLQFVASGIGTERFTAVVLPSTGRGGVANLVSDQSLAANHKISIGAYRLIMQGDGNLVEYRGTTALWASGTWGHPGARVVMQQDGNLVEYLGSTAIWASGTWGHPGAHLALQGSDGNVVIYGSGGQVLWASGT